MTSFSGSLAPLSHANFRWYFIASTVNTAGSTMAGVSLSFAVLSITDSASSLGLVLAAETVPTVLFLLFGGVVADRLPLTLVLRLGMLVLGLTQGAAAALVITGKAEIWMLMALAFVNGTTLAVTFPAMASIMPRLVPPELLQQANALQSFSRGALRIIGPTIAALLVVGVGAGWGLAFDAATWLAAAAILAKVALPVRPPRAERTSTFDDLREGWTYVRTTTWLWVVVLAFGVLNAIHAGAWFTLGPARAKETIGVGGWGLVLSAESLGLIATAFVLLRRTLQRPLLSGMLGIATLSLPIVALGVAPHLGLLVVCAFVAGAGTEVFSMGWTLAMQEHVPPDMLSRAYSYDALGSFVAIPLGQLAFGPLGSAFGYTDVLVVSGIVYLLVCLLTLLSRPVRDLRRVPVAEPAERLLGNVAAMDLTLTDEEREIRDWVRTFVTKELMPLEPKVLERERHGERGFSLEELRALQEKAKQSGFFGVLTPEEYGGMGLGSLMAALIETELGRTFVPVQVRRRRRQHPVPRQRRAEEALPRADHQR